jgi:hypothetical protein
MKIGYSFWGFLEKYEDAVFAQTPDGLRLSRPLLVDELQRRGHTVFCMQQKREALSYPNSTYADGYFPDLDVLFVEWRWPTYKNFGEKKFEPDWDRQVELLDHYTNDGTRVIVLDTDHKVRQEDEDRWPHMEICDPSFRPKILTKKRSWMPIWSDFKPLFEAPDYSYCYGYVGNRYEREESIQKYYGIPSQQLRDKGVQTIMWGNWLQKSPEREEPSKIISRYSTLSFGLRRGFYESMQILNGFNATTHIAKDDYYKTGYVSPRVFEALQCGVPALVPVEHEVLHCLGDDWIVHTSDDVVDKVSYLSKLSKSQRENVVKQQLEGLMSFADFTVTGVANFIEGQ